jgi:uncharacterized protein YjbI with pentapeptide repeats
MANSEHLNKLKCGPGDWNSWRTRHPKIEPDLSNADLTNLYLSGANLSGAELKGADLDGADLSGADLSDANLEDADLTDANLCKTNLNNACLSSAKLVAADLSEANLHDADLGYVDLTFAQFLGANLSYANLEEATGDEVNFQRANISYVDMTSAMFPSGDFTGANLYHSDLKSATLGGSFSGADLSDTLLDGATLDGELSGANLSGALINDADLSQANLSKANLSNAKLTGTMLKGADLTGVNLTGAKLDGTDFSNAKIGFTIFANNDLSEAEGLETVEHQGPSTIGIDTVYQSQGVIPEEFLRGAGVSENFISYLASQADEPLVRHYSCFISYSSKDKQFVEKLHADLQSKKLSCWYAPEDLKLGEKIRIGIDNSIRRYDKLLLVLSKHSVDSDWVEKEVETAMEFERKTRRLILIPIRIDGAVMKVEIGWPADIRRTRNIGDFRRWRTPDTYQEAFARLIHDLEVEN